jgi:hypothetical protein
MIRSPARFVVAALGGMLVCAPLLAGTTPTANKRTIDPNEIICEKQQVVGSRLQSKRVCMTRSQWADRRNQERQAIDRAQTLQSVKGP